MKIEIPFKQFLTKSDLNRLRLLVRNKDFEKDVWKLRIIFGYEDNFHLKERPVYYDELFQENKAIRDKVLNEKGKNYIEGLFKEIETLVRRYNIPLGWKMGIFELIRRGEFLLTARWIDKITFGFGEKEFESMTNDKAAILPPAGRDGLHIVIHDKVSKNQLIKWLDRNWYKIEKVMQLGLPDDIGVKIKSINLLEKIADLRDKKGLSFREITNKIKANDEQKITLYYQRYKRYLKSIKKR